MTSFSTDKRLYIIGNGFDLYHGIKSSYLDFKNYVQMVDKDLFVALDNYFEQEKLWSDFEATLAELKVEDILGNASTFLKSYDAEDWSDSYHHDYEYEIQKAINLVTEDLRNHFVNWVFELEILHSTDTPQLYLPDNSYYLTFNYTKTLEKLYSINRQKIKHIHNKIDNPNSPLILGHARNPIVQKPKIIEDPDDIDVRVQAGNRIIDNYFQVTYKDTITIIDENRDFFFGLKPLKEIYILGHSISEIDFKYYETITGIINISDVKWNITYFRKSDIENFTETLKSLGINESQIRFGQMRHISPNPLQTVLF